MNYVAERIDLPVHHSKNVYLMLSNIDVIWLYEVKNDQLKDKTRGGSGHGPSGIKRGFYIANTAHAFGSTQITTSGIVCI